MKRLFYLLFILPLILVSCDDDNELPDVKFNVEISGGKNVNGIIYVVKGDTLTVEKVEILSHNTKGAAMGEVSYFWDGLFLLTNPFPPYKINIATDRMGSYEYCNIHDNGTGIFGTSSQKPNFDTCNVCNNSKGNISFLQDMFK